MAGMNGLKTKKPRTINSMVDLGCLKVHYCHMWSTPVHSCSYLHAMQKVIQIYMSGASKNVHIDVREITFFFILMFDYDMDDGIIWTEKMARLVSPCPDSCYWLAGVEHQVVV